MTPRLFSLYLGLLLAALALPAARAAEEEVLCYRPDAKGFIRSWLVSSRHLWEHPYMGATMDFDALTATGGEAACAPKPGQPAGKGTPWREHHFRPGDPGYAAAVCNFREIGGMPWEMVYVFAYLYCEQEYRDLTMLTGSDDALLVVLNGEKVCRIQTQRGYAVAQDKTPGLTLKKGWNRVLCKVDDYMGGMGLFLQFMRQEDKPLVDEIRICFDRPADGVTPKFVDGETYETAAAKQLKDAVKLAMEKADYAGAATACRAVLTKYPKSASAAEALYQAGSFLRQGQQPEAALKALDETHTRFPFSPWAANALGVKAETLAAKPDAAAAESAWQELLTRFPESVLVPDALLKLALSQRGRGDFAASDLTLANQLLRRFADTCEGTLGLELQGDNRQSRQQTKEAKETWKLAAEQAQKLIDGKYVWDVNAQMLLARLIERCKLKMDGRPLPQ